MKYIKSILGHLTLANVTVIEHFVDLFRLFLLLTKVTDAISSPILTLHCWCAMCIFYPLLSPFALDITATPASKAYAERVFSVAGKLTLQSANVIALRRTWKDECSMKVNKLLATTVKLIIRLLLTVITQCFSLLVEQNLTRLDNDKWHYSVGFIKLFTLLLLF